MKVIIEYIGKEFLRLLKSDKYDSIYYDAMYCGLKDFSIDCSCYLSIIEIRSVASIMHSMNKKFFLVCNEIYEEERIHSVSQIVLSNLDRIDGVIFSDVGLGKYLKDKCSLNLVLIYKAPTYLTNRPDIEFYKNYFGDAVVSNQLSLSEVDSIVMSSMGDLCLDVFVKANIFYSRRNLLRNFLLQYHKTNFPNYKSLSLQEMTRKELYPIREMNNRTTIYESGFSYLSNPCLFKKVKWGIIAGNFLTVKKYLVVLKSYFTLFKNQNEHLFLESLHKEELYNTGAYSFSTVLIKDGGKGE